MNAFCLWIRRALQARPLAIAIATIPVALAVVVLFAAFGATSVAAQGTTPPACTSQILGTRFSLPAMTAGQEALLPAVPGATAVCLESLEGSEGVAIKLKGDIPYTAVGNGTPLTVDDEFAASLALGDPSFNGSILKAAPTLPGVTIVALTDLSDGVTVWVGNPRPKVVTPVAIDQWQDVKIPGAIGGPSGLPAGKTKWSGNGVTVMVTSGAAFSANGTAVLPMPGKVGKFDFFVDGPAELELVGTVNGQRFFLSVDADSLATDAWLQRRVEPTTATTTGAAASTAGAQYTDLGGACFSAATCSAAQAVACVSGAPKLPCTPGDDLTVWGAPAPMTLWEALQLVK